MCDNTRVGSFHPILFIYNTASWIDQTIPPHFTMEHNRIRVTILQQYTCNNFL